MTCYDVPTEAELLMEIFACRNVFTKLGHDGARLGEREAQSPRKNHGARGHRNVETEEARPMGTEDSGAARGEERHLSALLHIGQIAC
jgi:hypothetical protein